MIGAGLDQPGALPLSVEARRDQPAFLSAGARGGTDQGQPPMVGVSNRGVHQQAPPGLTTPLLDPSLALAPPTGRLAGVGPGPQSGLRGAGGGMKGQGIAAGVATRTGPETQPSGSTLHLPDRPGLPAGLLDTAL